MNNKQWRKEQEIRAALALARVADISIREAFGELRGFRTWERNLQRLAEASCNGYPKRVTEYKDGKYFSYDVEDAKLKAHCEKREMLIEAAVKEAAARLKLNVEFQGDPRGLMFRLTYNGQEINFYTTEAR